MKAVFMVEDFQVEPLGIAYLASALRSKGVEPELLKTSELDRLYDIEPDVIGFSVTTGKHRKYIKIAEQAKRLCNAKIIFGGAHPTYFPEVITESSAIDFVIRGEADKSLPWAIENKISNKIVGFHPLVQDLDSLPFPDREFLYKYPENRDNPIKNVITSRGCRFSCPYCFNSLYRDFYKGQNWVRFRSVDNVIQECKELKKYPLKMIFFQDDEFLSNPNIHDLLYRLKTEVRVPFHCQIRIEFLTDTMAYSLMDSGCISVTFAVECGDCEQRKNLLKRNMSDEQILRGANLLHRYGIKIRTENMLGLPGESLEQMFSTLDLNAKIRPTIGWASIFQPYPRLPLGEYAREKGYHDGTDTFKEGFFEASELSGEHNKEVVNLQRLFGVAVNFPLVRKFINLLVKIPNNRFYDRLSAWWKNRQYKELFS